jgi:hypothetical protein
LPTNGDMWKAVNRKGEIIGNCIIEKIQLTKNQDKTALLTVLVDKEHLYDFVTVRRPHE